MIKVEGGGTLRQSSKRVDIRERSLEKAVKKFKLSKSFILKLIKGKFIHASDMRKYRMPILIDEEGWARLGIIAKNRRYKSIILDLNPSYFYDYCPPELFDYIVFHDFIDRFCWLVKLFYGDRENIKKRNYRLDILLQNYIKRNKFSLLKTSKQLAGQYNEDKICFHLQKAWYNEIARSIPLSEELLNVGTKIVLPSGNRTPVSWNIIQTYYSIYEFINAIDFCTTKNLDTVEHRKPSKYFNTNVLRRVSKVTLFYPFNITSDISFHTQYPQSTKYMYARYPRDREKDIVGIESDVKKSLRHLGNDKGQPRVTLINYLYDFRVWANYTGISSIVKLENGYLLSYLFKNMGMLNFFIAAIAELTILAKVGESKYIQMLTDFSRNYVLKQPELEKNRFIIPIFIRQRIYRHMGIVSSDVDFLLPPVIDPVRFVA